MYNRESGVTPSDLAPKGCFGLIHDIGPMTSVSAVSFSDNEEDDEEDDDSEEGEEGEGDP